VTATRIWIEPQRLRSLPLDPAARSILWRNLLSLVDGHGQQGEELQALHSALGREQLFAEIDLCASLCREGDWLAGLRRIEALQGQALRLGEQLHLGHWLLELLERLHPLLVAAAQGGEPAAEAAPSPSLLDPAERAELHWQVHRLLRLLDDLPLTVADRIASIAGPIAHSGALLWQAQLRQSSDAPSRLRALCRSQALLLVLAEELDPCPLWVAQGLREGLQIALAANDLPLPAAQLLRWARAYLHLGLAADQRDDASELLWPAEAALQVGEALRLKAFARS